MKTNKLPQSEYTDMLAAGSHVESDTRSNAYDSRSGHLPLTGSTKTNAASNDADYNFDNDRPHTDAVNLRVKMSSAQQDIAQSGYKKAKAPVDYQAAHILMHASDYQQLKAELDEAPLDASSGDQHDEIGSIALDNIKANAKSTRTKSANDSTAKMTVMPLTQSSLGSHDGPDHHIPERVFMNSLIKHTGIALAIIIPLAAFSAYAAPQAMPATQSKASSELKNEVGQAENTAPFKIKPSDIIYKSATMPTTVDQVDLEAYSGKWYEIGRLPMYFQRNCARDVTATYIPKSDGSGITVLNKCIDNEGSAITAEGLAKPVDDTGSKLKVTFLPSWIRWLPVGRADYWVLARDANYQTALVGTPDQDYLWLLARTPNISQSTYAKYRQIAQQQGYDLKEFQLTTQSEQTVNLVP